MLYLHSLGGHKHNSKMNANVVLLAQIHMSIMCQCCVHSLFCCLHKYLYNKIQYRVTDYCNSGNTNKTFYSKFCFLSFFEFEYSVLYNDVWWIW